MSKYNHKFLISFTLSSFSFLFIFLNSALADAFEDLGAYSSQGLPAGSSGFADGAFLEPICDIFSLMGNEMGGFLTAAALLVALVYAAVGGLSHVTSAIVVAVSAFSLTSMVSLYFGSFAC